MSFYIKSLFVAIPLFMILIAIEEVFARYKGIVVNRHADMISSLSSGMTNIIKNILKISIIIVSYSWLVENISIYKIEQLWIVVLCALVVQDFTGYWLHRLNHRVNIFWNRHVIHHSSEEFNLSCALRQSISQTFNYAAILMIPAALLGIPAYVFAILGPIHLFMQFWYHTRLINKMGILEYILVTPSHHRVHHAINPEYIDKNYSQIFIVWDKLFGTFQEELSEVKPVYGTLTPASTWNPVIINFKHLWQLLKDSWRTKNILDKIRIWFMPTGWRPVDVKFKYPIKKILNPYDQKKYNPYNPRNFVIFSWIEYFFASIMMFHLFILFDNQSLNLNYLYAGYIFVYIFIYSSILDNKKSFKIYGLIKLFLFSSILFYQNASWFGLSFEMTILFGSYILLSSLIPIFINK
ncbi:MAG: sterol desaturase [Candidatus Marinimicrobia bacterium]|nr:sterol desaturase [Candidatus Neomarinimicrobiota bacterium]|tara:strand:- start:33389 stop:34615 length:1227 start_codon:yes stop_codon:yes gene_type:complete